MHSKISKNLGIIYKCRSCMNNDNCIKMYKTFIKPSFLYAIEIWGHTVGSELDILNKVQSSLTAKGLRMHGDTLEEKLLT